MNKLCSKDLIVSRVFWAPALVFFIIVATPFIEFNLLFLLANVILTFVLVLGIPIIDDIYRTDPLFGSLPLRRSDVVKARYLSSGGIILGGLFLLLGTGHFLGFLFPTDNVNLGPILGGRAAVAFLILAALLVSFFLPFYFRLGLGRAIFAFMGTFLGILILASGAVKIIALSSGQSVVDLLGLERDFWFSPSTPLVEGIRAGQNALGLPLFALILIAVFSGIIFLSLRLSISFFNQRDL